MAGEPAGFDLVGDLHAAHRRHRALGRRSSVDLYWAGASDGTVYAGPSGSGFRAVFANPAGASVTDLDVDPGTPGVVYAAFSGSGARRVYRLWRGDPEAIVLLARNITSDLPTGLAVKTLAVDRMQPDTVFVGTNAGVYRGRSLDGGVTGSGRPTTTACRSPTCATSRSTRPPA